jgi:molybdopterin synthase catalytic subunit
MEIRLEFTHGPIVVSPPGGVSRETGAVTEFYGLVREREGDRSLEGLQYEAYEAMAESELRRIFERLHTVYPVQRVWFVHRLGWVPVGEASLFVRVESVHRGEGFAFLGEAITAMKRDVPIWKRA